MRTPWPLLATTLLTMWPCRAGTISDIPESHQIILKKFDLRFEDLNLYPTWTPTPAQTKTCLTLLQGYLEKETKDVVIQTWQEKLAAEKAGSGHHGTETPESYRKQELKKVLQAPGGWYVQFWGVTFLEEKAPAKYIHCNFFPAGDTPFEFHAWRTQPSEVMDGGASFWQADYDPKTGEILVHTNGYAFNHPRSTSRPPLVAASELR